MDWMFNNFGGGGMPSLRRNASENRPAPPTYTINLRAYPALYLAREDLEPGNKILLPGSILHNLSAYKLPQPMIFSIQNTILGNSTNVGVLEFTAEEGTCILPNWMFETLSLDYGAEVNLQLLRTVKKGMFCKLQPHKTEFIDLPDPRAILEKQLSNYVCLTQGDSISIKVLNTFYMLNVLEVKPQSDNNCICLIDADVEVDFAAPLDYVEKPPELIKRSSSVNLDDEEDDDDDSYFGGQGIKINGTKVDAEKRKKITNDEYDPRKHRLTNGVRFNVMGYEFKGSGVTIGGAPLHITTKPVIKPTIKNEPLPEIPSLVKKDSNTPLKPITGSLKHQKPIEKTPSQTGPTPTLNKQMSIEKPSTASKPGTTQINSVNVAKPGGYTTSSKPTTKTSDIKTEDVKDKKEESGIKNINPSIQKPGFSSKNNPPPKK